MAEDEAFGGAPEAIHQAAPFLPMPAILLLLAAAALWVFWTFLIQPGIRGNRRVAIYEAIRERANYAAAGRVEDAAMLVLRLRDEIRVQVGDLVAGGEMCAIVTGVENVLTKPPKLEAVAVAGGAKPQFTRLVTISENNAPADATTGEPAKPAAPPSANQQLHDIAKKFKKYWDDRPARLRDLEDAQRRLGL
jgi:hypothetical protein